MYLLENFTISIDADVFIIDDSGEFDVNKDNGIERDLLSLAPPQNSSPSRVCFLPLIFFSSFSYNLFATEYVFV